MANNELGALADLADSEFDGESYNGASLMATLGKIDAAAAASDSTFEGYSAWSVVLHVAWCKWVVARALLGEAAAAVLGPYPWPEGKGGFLEPADPSPAAWAEVLAYLPRLHAMTMKAMREADAAILSREVPEWKIPLGKAAAWLCSHDTYHTAQIRSMGVPGIGPSHRVY